MKYIFTFCFSVIVITINAQTQLAESYHGCGGATIAAFPSDASWSNVTYLFQRFEGGSWGTVHTTTTNWHLVTPGDITGPTNYRAILRNNVTLEERVTNGVTINPALFSRIVSPPNPVVTMYWGGDVTNGDNYVEVLPHPFGASSRPPYTFEYKKTTDQSWQNKVAATGVFIFPIEANAQYQFRVTDVCGQTSNILTSELASLATANLTATNCSGGTFQVGVTTNGFNFSQRNPFTFAVALLPPGTATNPVPDAILSSLNYVHPAGDVTGLPLGRYVIRGRDRFNVLTKYIIRDVAVTVNPPQYVGSTLGSSYCVFNLNIQPPPHLKGIRPLGSNQPYTFSSGPTFVDVPVGNNYEMVLQDTCGRISSSIPISISALPPRINSTPVTSSNCKYTITINADVCNISEYGIKPSGSSTISWQSSNVFTNLPMSATCDSVYVRDLTSGLITRREVCKPDLSFNATPLRESQDCSSLYYIQVNPILGVPPYSYSISFDGTNFTSPANNNTFSGLPPGTYTIKATDACGLSSQNSLSTREVGSVFYLKQSGVNINCTNGDTLGGYLKFGLRLFEDDDVLSPSPYHFEVKEVASVNGNAVVYGKTVYSGQSTDTIISIKGLEGGKEYGFFVSNACGQNFTSADRVLNVFNIPAFVSPQPNISIDATNCSSPFIRITNFPLNITAILYAGKGTAGTIQTLINDSTSDVLSGGFYTIRFTSSNINGCYWEKTDTIFVKTNDSTRAGEYDANVSNVFCPVVSTPISLERNLKNETPGGEWFADPALIWSNQAAGEFIPDDQTPGSYRITYLVTSDCGVSKFIEFQIEIDPSYCRITLPGDYQSAQTPTGCKTYTGNQWQHVFNTRGELVYSINAGNANTIQSTCWGVRALVPFGNPRSTVINGNTVYFAYRNFYIEPSGTTINNPPVRVRLYFQPDEINLLLNYLRSNGFPAATVNDLRILKKQVGPGSPVDLEVSNDPGTSSSLYSVITPIAVPFGSFGVYYFEIEINSFSELALVFSNNFSLPVTWLSVTGQIQNSQAIIKWSTANEANTKSFEVEHSVTGANYNKVGTVLAAGNSTTVKRYEFVHSSPTEGRNYYRIKQIDLDGRYTYSSIIPLTKNGSIARTTVAPNPVLNELILSFGNNASKTIRLYSMNGNLVLSKQVNEITGTYRLDLGQLPAGVYMLHLLAGKETEIHKIIKQ